MHILLEEIYYLYSHNQNVILEEILLLRLNVYGDWLIAWYALVLLEGRDPPNNSNRYVTVFEASQ